MQFTSQETSPKSFLSEATQSCDTFNPYQNSTTHNYFKDQIGYASSPFESNDLLELPMHQPEITQMPPSLLKNHKKQRVGRRTRMQNPKLLLFYINAYIMLLVQLVKQYGDKSWARIAENLPLRIGKQCRERWHNCLKPNITKNAWSEEDDKLLITLHKQFGNKWADIAKNMPGRSENNIKNHWNATKRKQFKFSSNGHKNTKHHSHLLKDYISSVSSSSSDNQSNIQENSSFDTQNHDSMSLNARSSSFPGSEVSYKPEELVVKESDFYYDEVSSHLIDQLQFDPPIDTDMFNF
ncbi:hypothetical protein R6Q57_012083 [Mikania cordata]